MFSVLTTIQSQVPTGHRPSAVLCVSHLAAGNTAVTKACSHDVQTLQALAAHKAPSVWTTLLSGLYVPTTTLGIFHSSHAEPPAVSQTRLALSCLWASAYVLSSAWNILLLLIMLPLDCYLSFLLCLSLKVMSSRESSLTSKSIRCPYYVHL